MDIHNFSFPAARFRRRRRRSQSPSGSARAKMGVGASSSAKQAGQLRETLGDHDESINCMALSDDGSMLVTGSEDSTARMWSLVTGETECLGVLR